MSFLAHHEIYTPVPSIPSPFRVSNYDQSFTSWAILKSMWIFSSSEVYKNMNDRWCHWTTKMGEDSLKSMERSQAIREKITLRVEEANLCPEGSGKSQPDFLLGPALGHWPGQAPRCGFTRLRFWWTWCLVQNFNSTVSSKNRKAYF